MEKIDNNNYEMWLLRYAEGELSAAERAEVEAWLADHPEAAEELALYNEAPRLEADESVRYGAVPRQHTHPLWPALLRWSAAAAVVVALMVPALRMGTMDSGEETTPQLLAQAEAPSLPSGSEESSISRKSRLSRISRESREPVLYRPLPEVEPEEVAAPAAEPAIIEVSTLIAFEPEAAPADTLYTTALIATERPTSKGDMLLAFASIIMK